MPRNKEGSVTETIYAWVPCANCLKERERERDAKEYQSTTISKGRKERYICMKNA